MAKLPKVSVPELPTLEKAHKKRERKTKYAELKNIFSVETPKKVEYLVEYLKDNDGTLETGRTLKV
jgi:hypothetical protein|tara:strand:- start:1773 stop:1970 length:198 start_codon:yes stop_codon:yes gene_type:complete